MRVDRGVDRFVADAASGIIRFHGLQPARDLLRRPAEMNKPVTDPAVEPATLDQLARPPAPTPPDLVNRTSDLRAVAAILTLATPQFPADRARSPAQKPPDCPKARAPSALGKDHAAFFMAQVPVSSSHRNNPSRSWQRCCTCCLSLSSARWQNRHYRITSTISRSNKPF